MLKKDVRFPTLFLAFPFLAFSFSFSEMKPTDPAQRAEQYSLTEGKTIPIPAKKANLPLIVFGDEAGQMGTFIPSGYMGDAGALEIKTTEESVSLKSGAPGVHSLCVSFMSNKRLRAKAKGAGWAGVYWQTPANNWGKIKGAGYDLSAAQKLTFWAKGALGGEVLAEVKVGGLVGPYPDTDVSSIGPLRLTNEWKQYTIPLEMKDLNHILGGFAFSVRRADNPHGAVFYLDEILFEGEESEKPAPALPDTALSPAHEQKRAAVSEPLKETRTFMIPFTYRRAEVQEAAESSLDQAVEAALKYPGCRVQVEGHTDSIGSQAVNKKLSEERAQAVADYLVSRGVAKDRVSVEGFGEGSPLFPESNRSEEGRNRNRRVNIILIPD